MLQSLAKLESNSWIFPNGPLAKGLEGCRPPDISADPQGFHASDGEVIIKLYNEYVTYNEDSKLKNDNVFLL